MASSNKDIVDAIDRRIGNFNALYALSTAIIFIMLLLAIIGFFSINRTNEILEEFVSEVKLNSKDRETNVLTALALKEHTNALRNLDTKLSRFMEQQEKTNDNQRAFNNKHAMVLDDAGSYIKQNPIELLRKGK